MISIPMKKKLIIVILLGCLVSMSGPGAGAQNPVLHEYISEGLQSNQGLKQAKPIIEQHK